MNHKKKATNSCIFSYCVVQILNFILSLPFPNATPRDHDAQYSDLTSAESKHAGRCTNNLPYTYIVQCLIRHKNSFSISFTCLPLLYSPSIGPSDNSVLELSTVRTINARISDRSTPYPINSCEWSTEQNYVNKRLPTIQHTTALYILVQFCCLENGFLSIKPTSNHTYDFRSTCLE